MRSTDINKFTVFLERYWIPLGVLFLFCGMFLHPSRGSFKTLVGIGVILPALLHLLLHWNTAVKSYFSPAVFIFYAALLYVAASVLWGDGDLISYARRVAKITLVGYAVYILYSRQRALFYRLSVVAVIVAAIICLFWLVDYYCFLNHPYNARFLSGRVDSFEIYQKGYYGGFYNPLLLGHVLVFLFVLGVNLIVVVELRLSHWLRASLVVSCLVLFVMLILSQARLSLILAILVVIFWAWHRLRWKSIYIFIFMAAVIQLFLYFYGDFLLGRGLSYRPEIWQQSWAMIQESWLFGYGMGSELKIAIVKNHDLSDTHNIYLAILYYSGFTGLLLVAVAIVLVVFDIWKHRQFNFWFYSWFMLLCLGGMVDGGGLLARPGEHWFNLVLPAIFLLALSRAESRVKHNKDSLEFST